MAWKEDGSGQLVLDGAKVTNIGGKKANAMWVDGQGGAGQWTFTLGPSGQGGVWVGVAEEGRFGPGYQVKGLMFGGPGNLSDGSALIAGHWGPKVEAGDRLDMRLEVNKAVVLSFRHNGKPLGAAFHINNWTGGVLRPVVSLSSKEQEISIAASTLSDEDFALQPGSNNGDTVEGKWIAEDLEVTIAKENSSSWRLSAKVANSISATVTRTEGGGWSVGSVISTQMMPPPHLEAKERAFTTLLTNLTDLRLEGTNLALVARESVQILSPAVPPPPVTREKIRWLN